MGSHPICYEARAELQGLSMPLRASLYRCGQPQAGDEQPCADALQLLSSMEAAMDIYTGA